LIGAARRAAQHARAPYSGFRVGAAVLAENGGVAAGFNIENASYGLTLCAERAALVHALCSGHSNFLALALCAGAGEPAAPCGACRQFMAEFMDPETPVFYSALPEGSPIFKTTVGELLPRAFVFNKGSA